MGQSEREFCNVDTDVAKHFDCPLHDICNRANHYKTISLCREFCFWHEKNNPNQRSYTEFTIKFLVHQIYQLVHVFFWRLYIIISTCYHLNPYPVVQKGGLSNVVQGLFLIFNEDRGRGRSLTYIDPRCLFLRCLVFVLKPDMLAVVWGFPVLQAVLVEVQQECGEWENGEWSRQGEERYGEEEDEGGGHAGV